MRARSQWCDDVYQAQQAVRYDFVFVDEEGYKKYQPKTFAALVQSFREYKE
jgi:type III restriction enzyme